MLHLGARALPSRPASPVAVGPRVYSTIAVIGQLHGIGAYQVRSAHDLSGPRKPGYAVLHCQVLEEVVHDAAHAEHSRQVLKRERPDPGRHAALSGADVVDLENEYRQNDCE